jgi:hypothetical protein
MKAARANREQGSMHGHAWFDETKVMFECSIARVPARHKLAEIFAKIFARAERLYAFVDIFACLKLQQQRLRALRDLYVVSSNICHCRVPSSSEPLLDLPLTCALSFVQTVERKKYAGVESRTGLRA